MNNAAITVPDGRTLNTKEENGNDCGGRGQAFAAPRIARVGCQIDAARGSLANLTPRERERWLLEDLHISNAQIRRYHIDGLAAHDSSLSIDLDVLIPTYASQSGDRLFLLPNIAERRTNIPMSMKERRSPIRFPFPYATTDSIWFRLPEGFVRESLPAAVELHSSFGDFRSATQAIGDTAIVYTRSITIQQFEVPPEKYQEYRQFFEGIVRADKAQAVFVRR